MRLKRDLNNQMTPERAYELYEKLLPFLRVKSGWSRTSEVRYSYDLIWDPKEHLSDRKPTYQEFVSDMGIILVGEA
jgi:hypothetical protein